MKKTILSLATISILTNSLYAEEKEDLLKYDIKQGWWFYETKVKDDKTKKEETVSIPVKPDTKPVLDEQKKNK